MCASSFVALSYPCTRHRRILAAVPCGYEAIRTRRASMHSSRPTTAARTSTPQPACRRLRRLGGGPSAFTMYGPSSWYPSLR